MKEFISSSLKLKWNIAVLRATVSWLKSWLYILFSTPPDPTYITEHRSTNWTNIRFPLQSSPSFTDQNEGPMDTVHLYRTFTCMCYVCLWYTDSPSIPNIYLYVLCSLIIYWQSIYTEHRPVRVVFAYDILTVYLYRTYTCTCCVCLWYTDSPSIPNIDLYVLCLLMIYWQSLYTEQLPVCVVFAYDILTVHLYRT